MKDKILIIGGYGQVGRNVCTELMNIFPNKIIIGGRNIKKAVSFSEETQWNVKPLKIDIYDTRKYNAILNDISLVVMCLSPKNTDLALYCIENNINYIDISPSYKMASELALYKNIPIKTQATCVLGVGLAPGLSNLMVKKAKSFFDYINSVNIFLMLGVGEKHGNDGIKWLLDNINNVYTINYDNKPRVVTPFGTIKKTTFIDKTNQRKTFSFDLADQHSIPKTLGLANVSSYFCYDSSFVTREIVLLKKIGFFKMLRISWMYNFIANIFRIVLDVINRLKLCSDIYIVKIDIEGVKDNESINLQSSIVGYNNSIITGKIAAIVAKQIYTGKIKRGIYYLEEMFDFDSFYSELKNDITYTYKINQ
ncbi:MAG: Saccharopine dehydrogenase [Bacteroidetes bacterium]|nr:Saccharopine dehydrogenase [Bacteroidota bacterium]